MKYLSACETSSSEISEDSIEATKTTSIMSMTADVEDHSSCATPTMIVFTPTHALLTPPRSDT